MGFQFWSHVDPSHSHWMNDPHQQYQIARWSQAFPAGFWNGEENKENDDPWFNDFFAEPEEKQREERKAAQEQGRNAMQARLKAQKQALEAPLNGS